ncbi:MAG TPA: hypothetical protein VII72_11380 [Myxococcota bacterium]|jgi:hypothetical protein
MQTVGRKLALLGVLALSFASHAIAEEVVIIGSDGYQPPNYVLPVPPALKIIRGQNASALDLRSDHTDGEYLMRWQIPGTPPWYDTVGYINSGGYMNMVTALTVSGNKTGCLDHPSADLNCRFEHPYAPFMIGAWSDLGPDGIAIVSRANNQGGPPFGALDRDGNVTTRIEEYGTISLKPQASDADVLPGYGRVFVKDLGANEYGLFWRDPTGAVRRIDSCP